MKKTYINKRSYIYLALLVCISSAIYFIYYKKSNVKMNNDKQISESVIEKVNKIIALPSDEVPAIGTIENVEKLKFLNSCVTDRSGRFDVSDDWYKSYIIRFYSDKQFNRLYEKWLETEDKYLRPTIDHIEPRSKGGGNELSNLQFLSWFENKAKNDMSQEEWDNIKANIKDYLI